MCGMENDYHLTPKQVITRIISVLACAIGVGTCIYSLGLQIEDVGTATASITWFAGLGCVVFASAGYVVTCDPGKGKSRIPIAVVCIAALAILWAVLAQTYLYTGLVITVALIGIGVQLVVLIVYHYILKAQDPDAA